jgi:hypothetical protein
MLLPGDRAVPGESSGHFHWSKFPHMAAIANEASWKLTLDLETSSKQRRGSMVIYRIYSSRDLQLDVNLLTAEFPGILADAIQRVLTVSEVLEPVTRVDTRLAANL